MGAKQNVYKVLAGTLERNKPLRRPRHRLKNNIKIGEFYLLGCNAI
jgi:hypothetical protein